MTAPTIHLAATSSAASDLAKAFTAKTMSRRGSQCRQAAPLVALPKGILRIGVAEVVHLRVSYPDHEMRAALGSLGTPGYGPAMASVIKSVTFDAGDALALATFWAAVFGSDVDEDSTTDRAFVEAAGWGGPNIWFNRVPEGKTAKNRVHFDLRAPGTMADEVARLERLGATTAHRYPDLTAMRDPEGNEFCVESGPAGV